MALVQQIAVYATPALLLSVFIFGIATLWVMNLMFFLQPRRGVLRYGMEAIAWLSICGALLGLLASVLLLGAVYWFVALAAILFVVGLLSFAWYRQAEVDTLVWSLGAAMRRGIPLAEGARHMAAERADRLGSRMAFLADRLDAGVPVEQALCVFLPRADIDTRLLVQLAARWGDVSGAMQQTDATDDSKIAMMKSVEGVLYLVLMTIVGIGVCAYFFINVMPEIKSMLNEFQVKLPRTAEVVFSIGHWLEDHLVVSAILAQGLLVLLFAAVFAICQQAGLFFVDMPLFSRLGATADRARIMQSLALGFSYQRPVHEICQALAILYPKRYIRRRLRRAVTMLEQGQDWCQTLRRVKLIRNSDRDLLYAAERVGNLPFALKELAAMARRRFADRLRVALQFATPVLVTCFGLIVLMFALSLFMPLFALIQGLS